MNEHPSPVIAAGDTIAVTGATGYVGGRLVPALLEAGYRVRCLVREPRKLDARPWRNHPHVEVLTSDLGDSAADTAVFLTVMPDAREAQTRYAIGSGSLTEPWRFNWQQPGSRP